MGGQGHIYEPDLRLRKGKFKFQEESCVSTWRLVPYISGNSKAPDVGTLPMFCIEKPLCACTAQRNLRISWCLQNRILVSVKIKLQAITSGNDNKTRPYMVIYSTAPWAINNIPAPKAGP